jgi:hypothetical protein
MSVIVPPPLRVNSFRWTLSRNEIENRSVFGAQAIEAGVPLWAVSMTGPPQRRNDAIAFEQFLESFEGLLNQVELYHRAQRVPAGSLRGVLTLSAPAAAGALALVINAGAGQAGATLKRGDLIGLGGGLNQQVLRVSADAVTGGDGRITVALNTSLRAAFPAGVGVVWDRPRALFRQVQNNSGISYVPGVIGRPWQLDLIEDWRP